MSEIVDRLCTGSHPVAISLRPERTATALKERIERYGFVHIKFIDTRGGTELGVKLDKDGCNLGAADFNHAEGKISLSGRLKLNYVPVRCFADIDLSTLEGTGYLRKMDTLDDNLEAPAQARSSS
jgi:hypothetical protein